MKLEDTTKEELICFIEENSFILEHALKNFESTIVFYRLQKRLEERNIVFKQYSKALNEYVDFLEPYDNINDMPKEIFEKGLELERKMKALEKKLRKVEKEYENLRSKK